MTNAYQPFFDKLDKTIAALEGDGETTQVLRQDAADLLRRAGFFLVNHLNTTVELAAHLVLPENEAVPPPAERGDSRNAEPEGTSVEETGEPEEGSE